MSHLEILVLGCSGGPFTSNLSCYALIDHQNKEAILLDGGTLLEGLQRAHEKGNLGFLNEKTEFVPPLYFLQEYVKVILISHVHLDHILGMVLASQSDRSKVIASTDLMIDLLRDHIFNGKIWANMANEGQSPNSLYQYQRLALQQKSLLKGTQTSVEAFMLNHSATLPSTAYLLENGGDYVLYFGDTSSDFVEEEKRNAVIWERVAPLVKEGKMKAVFIECSYHNKKIPLFGHLNPDLLMKELDKLQAMSSMGLKDLKVIITHRKQNTRLKSDHQKMIEEELRASNSLGINFIFPEQGDRIQLS